MAVGSAVKLLEQFPSGVSGIQAARQFCWAREGVFGDGLREQKKHAPPATRAWVGGLFAKSSEKH